MNNAPDVTEYISLNMISLSLYLDYFCSSVNMSLSLAKEEETAKTANYSNLSKLLIFHTLVTEISIKKRVS